ncbi:MAG: hypothetical protein ACKVOQ_08355 [Cyclobacteriaceae bacterium]
MKEFKTNLNPLIPLIRFLGVLIFGVVLIKIFYTFFRNLTENSAREYFILFVGVPLIGYLFYVFLKGFSRSTKNYVLDNFSLRVFNLLTLQTEKISKENIRGFSTSEIPYRIATFKQIIIYLRDGRKLELMQFEYFNFRKIESALCYNDYIFLGHELYVWKFLDFRVYHFE